MNKILIPFILILSISQMCLAEDSIKSILGIPFGQICTIKAVFIDKPNSYYAQNVSHSDYYLKIFEINSKILQEPLVVEPVFENLKIDKSKTYMLKAYETIQSDGEPSDWSDLEKQFNYTIRSKIVIKPL
ncbi:MAG: hypothetical protein ABIK92_08050 [Pseudomonadota bacterium]